MHIKIAIMFSSEADDMKLRNRNVLGQGADTSCECKLITIIPELVRVDYDRACALGLRVCMK